MTSNFISVDYIREKTTPIFNNYPVGKVILFGFYAKGNATNGVTDILLEARKRDSFAKCNPKLRFRL